MLAAALAISCAALAAAQEAPTVDQIEAQVRRLCVERRRCVDDAPGHVTGLCASPRDCDFGAQVVAELKQLQARLGACGRHCPGEVLEEATRRLDAISNRSLFFPNDFGVFKATGILKQALGSKDLTAALAELDRLEPAVSRLEQLLAEADRRYPGMTGCPDGLQQILDKLTVAGGSAALDLEGVQTLLNGLETIQEQTAPPMRARANAVSARLSALRARLIGMSNSHCPGLLERWAMGAQAQQLIRGVPADPAPNLALLPAAGGSRHETGVQQVIVPRKTDKPGQAVARNKGIDQYPETVAMLEDMKRRGLTRTVGAPGERVAVYFNQSEGDCAVASEAEIMIAAGLFPGQSPAEVEKRLIKEARALGIYGNGTPTSQVGALLERHGFLVERNLRARPQDLEAAVLAGNWVLAEVESAILWNLPPDQGGGHVVTVTGAELQKTTGAVLGFYINDTGSSIAARLVPVAQFYRAWSARFSPPRMVVVRSR